MIQDHEPVEFSDFNCLWSRDSSQDSVPKDYSIDLLNTISEGGELRTRDGFSPDINLANIRRSKSYRREGEATRTLLLDSSGHLYDSGNSLSVPILTIVGMTDFSVVQVYNRCYITPHNGIKGLAGELIYVYQGSGTARHAAGLAPVGSFTVSNSATAGSVEAGIHLVGWCYETDTGFVTPPGEINSISVDGTKCLDFTNIPVGPTGTAKRRLIASQAIQDYNGNTEGYEMFFVPDGTINDNSSTSLSEIDFFDGDLQVSADYTFDQYETLSAGVFITAYGTSMVFGGTDADPSVVYISKETEPESVSSLSGFIICDPSETEGVKNAVQFRGSLYITKGNPGRTYITTRTTYDPSTWSLDTIDSGIGANCHCVSEYIDIQGANADFFCVADIYGFYKFDGSYNKDYPLTYNIQKTWERINTLYFHTVQVIIDATKKLVYILAPLDSATHPSHILVGDYQDGLDAKNIKWHVWNSIAFTPQSIHVSISTVTKKTVLNVADYTTDTYKQVPGQFNDNNSAIDNYYYTALAYSESNWIHHFGFVSLAVKGSGTLVLTAWTKDLATSVSLPSITLAATPGRDYGIPMNVTNEKCAIKIGTNSANSYFKLRRLSLYIKPVWATRPF